MTNKEELSRDNLAVELTEKYTDLEINLHRLAHSRAATEKEADAAAVALFRSLRARGGRYLVRQLGSETLKATKPGSHSGYNAII